MRRYIDPEDFPEESYEFPDIGLNMQEHIRRRELEEEITNDNIKYSFIDDVPMFSPYSNKITKSKQKPVFPCPNHWCGDCYPNHDYKSGKEKRKGNKTKKFNQRNSHT